MNRDQGAPEKPYGMTIDQRRKAVITGVTDVESFDDSVVVLHTHGGRLTLQGSGLHVSSLQLEEGRLMVEGAIDGAAYEAGKARRKGGFIRRALG